MLADDLPKSSSRRVVEIKASFNGLRNEWKSVNGIEDNSFDNWEEKNR